MKVIIIVFLFFSALSAEARTLKDVMGEMGPHFRTLGRSLQSPAQNADSIRLLQALQTLVTEAQALRPTKLSEMPENEIRGSELRYLQLILSLNLQIIEGELALQRNDQDAAKLAFAQMNQLRQQGHSEFQE